MGHGVFMPAAVRHSSVIAAATVVSTGALSRDCLAEDLGIGSDVEKPAGTSLQSAKNGSEILPDRSPYFSMYIFHTMRISCIKTRSRGSGAAPRVSSVD